MTLTFTIIEPPPPPDLKTPVGKADHLGRDLVQLENELNPQLAGIYPIPSTQELFQRVRTARLMTDMLHNQLAGEQRRAARTARAEAAGALPWLAVRAVMLERGLTHVRFFNGTAGDIREWSGPYGPEIVGMWRGVLAPERGPGWFSDYHDPQDTSGLLYGVWECFAP